MVIMYATPKVAYECSLQLKLEEVRTGEFIVVVDVCEFTRLSS